MIKLPIKTRKKVSKKRTKLLLSFIKNSLIVFLYYISTVRFKSSKIEKIWKSEKDGKFYRLFLLNCEFTSRLRPDRDRRIGWKNPFPYNFPCNRTCFWIYALTRLFAVFSAFMRTLFTAILNVFMRGFSAAILYGLGFLFSHNFLLFRKRKLFLSFLKILP